MSTFEIKKFALSSIGAIALSATCIFAAVGPARAANAPLTTAQWQQIVSAKVSGATDSVAARMAPGKVAETAVAVRFTAEGDFAGASVARSSGNAAIDRHAVSIAEHVAYPPLPAGYRGRAQTIMLRLAMGDEQAIARHFARTGTATAARGTRGAEIAAR